MVVNFSDRLVAKRGGLMETRGRGRPTGPGGPKNGQVNIRLSERELKILETIEQRTKLNKTDILLKGLYKVYLESVRGSKND